MVHEGITGRALREGRELARLSRLDLAYLAGLSLSTVNRLEQHDLQPVSCLKPVMSAVTNVLEKNRVAFDDDGRPYRVEAAA